MMVSANKMEKPYNVLSCWPVGSTLSLTGPAKRVGSCCYVELTVTVMLNQRVWRLKFLVMMQSSLMAPVRESTRLKRALLIELFPAPAPVHPHILI